MPKENITIGRRLKDLGCPPDLQDEQQVFSLLRENLTNLSPKGSKQNLMILREGVPTMAEPPKLTSQLERALRSGELGDDLRTVYLAGLIQAGENITDNERTFVIRRVRDEQNIDLGSFTMGR